MTPSEMLRKYKETGSAEFVVDLDIADVWAFLELEPLAFCKWAPYPDYQDFRPHVVFDLKSRYEADVDTWLNENASIQIIRDNRERWIGHLAAYIDQTLRYNEGTSATVLREILAMLQEV